MRTIWKFDLEESIRYSARVEGVQVFDLEFPIGSITLDVQMQDGRPVFWVDLRDDGPPNVNRGQHTLENLAWLCQPCHEHVHAHVEWAKEHGFLRSRPPMGECPGPSSRAQRITRTDIAAGQAECCVCDGVFAVVAEPSGGMGPVLAEHEVAT